MKTVDEGVAFALFYFWGKETKQKTIEFPSLEYLHELRFGISLAGRFGASPSRSFAFPLLLHLSPKRISLFAREDSVLVEISLGKARENFLQPRISRFTVGKAH